MIVAPGFRSPLSSASSIIASATRSLTLPPGLNDSIFAIIGCSSPFKEENLFNSNKGVFPISSVSFFAIFVISVTFNYLFHLPIKTLITTSSKCFVSFSQVQRYGETLVFKILTLCYFAYHNYGIYVKKSLFYRQTDKKHYICDSVIILQESLMQKYANYIEEIEIDSLWSGKKHIRWTLDRQVNILSGINGVGKSTIINKVVRSFSQGGEFPSHLLKGVRLKVNPSDAKWIRYDIIRSFDRPLLNSDSVSKMDGNLSTELDWQLFQLQRKYLDYQVNIGNRIIATLQSGKPHATEEAQRISLPKKRFQDMIDDLFTETGKTIIRTENEIRFSQIGETLYPYQLSSGEKQILVILLTVLVEDNKPYVLFMDEPEVSLHVDWQKRLIDLILELNPNVQIILSTHSPAVIMNGWIDRVTEVSDITDK